MRIAAEIFGVVADGPAEFLGAALIEVNATKAESVESYLPLVITSE
jgi:hypothetical protein